MNSKELLKIKKDFKDILNDKSVYDVVLFGSFVKGKINPQDIDIAIITNKDLRISGKYHVSFISLNDFFKPISLINTLLREGYSLKRNKPFSEVYGFFSRTLFRYDLSNLPSSKKVQVVNFLRGKGKEEGLVIQRKGEWVSNQVFLSPTVCESIFENFFINSKVKFKKYYVLIA